MVDMIFLLLLCMLLGCLWALRYVTSGKTNRTTDSTKMITKKNVQEVVNQLKRIAGELRADISPIQDDPFGKFGDSDDIAVVMHGESPGFSRNIWAVQIYVNIVATGCEVELIAVGEGISAGYTGTYYTGRINMKDSKKQRDIIVSRL